MYFVIYKTTNLINNKFYIGKHKTVDLLDGYLGSGVAIRSAIKKYGVKNFKYEVLELLTDEKSLNDREREIVNADFLIKNKGKCYNISLGGTGGDANNFRRNQTQHEIAAKAAKTLKSKPEKLYDRNRKISEKTKLRAISNPESFIGGIGNKGKTKETDEGIRRQIAVRRTKTLRLQNERYLAILNCVNEGMKRKEILNTLEYSSAAIDRVLRTLCKERKEYDPATIN